MARHPTNKLQYAYTLSKTINLLFSKYILRYFPIIKMEILLYFFTNFVLSMIVKIRFTQATIDYTSYTISNAERKGKIYACKITSFHDFLFTKCDLIFYKDTFFGPKTIGHTAFKICDVLLGKTKYFIEDESTLGQSKWYNNECHIGEVYIKAVVIEDKKHLTDSGSHTKNNFREHKKEYESVTKDAEINPDKTNNCATPNSDDRNRICRALQTQNNVLIEDCNESTESKDQISDSSAKTKESTKKNCKTCKRHESLRDERCKSTINCRRVCINDFDTKNMHQFEEITYTYSSFEQISKKKLQPTLNKNDQTQLHEIPKPITENNASLYGCESNKNTINDVMSQSSVTCYDTGSLCEHQKTKADATSVIKANEVVFNDTKKEVDQKYDLIMTGLQKKYRKVIDIVYDKEYFATEDLGKAFTHVSIFNFTRFEMLLRYTNHAWKFWRLFRYVSKGSVTCHIFYWYGLIRLNNIYDEEKNNKKAAYSTDNNDLENLSENVLKMAQNDVQINQPETKSLDDEINMRNRKVKKYNQAISESYSESVEAETDGFFQKYFLYLFTTDDKAIEIQTYEVNQNKNFYTYYINKYYYTIGVYTSPLLFVKIKKRKNNSSSEISRTRADILSYLNIENKDLLEVNLSSKKSETPHIIFYDKDEDEIVVSFRGTQSHRDALNDIDCEYVEFYDGFAHAGILGLAKKFLTVHIESIKTSLERRNTKKVLFTGHSLGGAISALVYILAIENMVLPGCACRAICFSSPPIISINLCNKYKDITNFVFQNDIVPRLSFGSLLDLKYLAISAGKKKHNMESLQAIIDYLLKKDINPKLYLVGTIYHVLNDGNVYKKNPIEINVIVAHPTCFMDHLFYSLMNGLNCGLNNAKNTGGETLDSEVEDAIDDKDDNVNKN